MSYVRWSDISDVYMYSSVNGKEVCCQCSLGSNNEGDYDFDTIEELIAHAIKHKEAGHLIPNYAMRNLKYWKET